MNTANTHDVADRSDAAHSTEPADRRGPRWPTWVRALAPPVLFLPTATAGLLLYLIPGFGSLLPGSDTRQLLGYIPFTAVTLAAYLFVAWALVRWVDRRRFQDLGLRANRRALLGMCAGCGLALLAAIVASGFITVFGLGRPLDTGSVPTQIPTHLLVSSIMLLLLQAFVMQGIGEEVLFRGYLMQSLRRRPILGVLVTAVAFTVPHLVSSGGQQNSFERVMYLAMPFGFALSAGFLAVALRSVWAAIGVHGGFHVANFVVGSLGWLAVNGTAVYVAFGLAHLIAAIVIGVLIPQRRWAEVRVHGPYGSAESPR